MALRRFTENVDTIPDLVVFFPESVDKTHKIFCRLILKDV
jgi:hypothetical protein